MSSRFISHVTKFDVTRKIALKLPKIARNLAENHQIQQETSDAANKRYRIYQRTQLSSATTKVTPNLTKVAKFDQKKKKKNYDFEKHTEYVKSAKFNKTFGKNPSIFFLKKRQKADLVRTSHLADTSNLAKTAILTSTRNLPRIL